MVCSGSPAAAAADATPILSEWLVKSPGAPVDAVTSLRRQQNQFLDAGRPLDSLNNGPLVAERRRRYDRSALTGQSSKSGVAPRVTVQPLRKGSVLETLIRKVAVDKSVQRERSCKMRLN